MSCGHFNFSVRDCWIFCSDCDIGIDANSPKGKRMIERKRGDRRLDTQQLAAFKALQASYQKLVLEAGTDDPDALAEYLHRRVEQ